MNLFVQKNVSFIVSTILLLIIFLYDISHSTDAYYVLADSSIQPSVQVNSLGENAYSILVTFPQEIPTGNIIDVELYDSNNQKVWQSFGTNGGSVYMANTSTLNYGTYRVAIGLFTRDWHNNYAWFQNVTTINATTANQALQTSMISPSLPPCVLPTTAVPTPSQSIANITTSQVSSTAMTAYNNWKSKYISVTGDSTRVIRPENNNDTVSEGIGYGMLLSAFANDQTTFSGLWKYAQKYFDDHGLMQWNISSSGNVIGTGAATDADQDIAYSLILGNQLWPSQGYENDAKQMINQIEQSEIGSQNILLPGDSWGNTSTVNPSYISPAYYDAFAQVTGNSHWTQIATTNINWLIQVSDSHTGFIPDWIQTDTSPANISWDTHPHDFYYDAARMPIRLLFAYKVTHNPDLKNILEKQEAFLATIGVKQLKSGYSLQGQPLTNYLDTPFKSSYAAAGNIEPNSAFARDSYNMLSSDNPTGYFGTSLRALTLFIIAK